MLIHRSRLCRPWVHGSVRDEAKVCLVFFFFSSAGGKVSFHENVSA